MQIGRDNRVAQSIPFTDHGSRRAVQQSQLSTAFLQSTNGSAVISRVSCNAIFMRVIDEYWEQHILDRVFYPYSVSFLLSSICNYTCQRKGEQSFGDDAYEWTQKLRLLYNALYPFYILHVINPHSL